MGEGKETPATIGIDSRITVIPEDHKIIDGVGEAVDGITIQIGEEVEEGVPLTMMI